MKTALALVVVSTCTSVALAAPRNESCDEALALTLPTALDASISETTAAQAASPCAVEDSYALWYTFTAPADTGVDDSFAFVVEGADGFDVTLALYHACDFEPVMACVDDEHYALDARIDSYLEPAQQVWVRVGGWGETRGDFRLVVDHVARVDAPSNDACADAIPITQVVPGAASTYHATGSDLSSCGPDDRVDIWYGFVAPSAGEYEIAVSQHMIRQHYVTLFDGCDGSELACGFESAKITLAAGQQVRVRIGTHPSSADWFNVVVRPGPPAAVPTNDTHLGAIPVTVGSRTAGSTRAATLDPIADWGIDCVSHVNAAIWYTFTAPTSDAYVFDTSASELDDTVVALFEDCGDNDAAPPDLIACNDFDGVGENGRIDGFIEAGATFCIAVAGHFLSEEGGVTLDVTRLGPAPVNDDCPGALPVMVGEPIFGVNYAAVPVDITTQCPGGNFALWYTFVAPADGLYKFDTKAGGDSWPDIALYADCQNAVPLACSVEAQPAVSLDMVAGQRVQVRVSTILYWRGTLPLRVGPMRAVAEPEPQPEPVPEAVPEPLVETVPEPLVEFVEVGEDVGVEVDVGVEREVDAGGGCGCGAGGSGAWGLGIVLVFLWRRRA